MAVFLFCSTSFESESLVLLSTSRPVSPPTHVFHMLSQVVISVPEVSEREGIAYPIPDWLDALVHQRNGSFPQVS